MIVTNETLTYSGPRVRRAKRKKQKESTEESEINIVTIDKGLSTKNSRIENSPRLCGETTS